MKNNFNLPEAPIQNNDGILIFSYENTEFVVDVNSKESEALTQLKHQVSEITEKSKIEIITISRPEAYGEYSPYRIMGTKEEFIKEVKREYGSSL